MSDKLLCHPAGGPSRILPQCWVLAGTGWCGGCGVGSTEGLSRCAYSGGSQGRFPEPGSGGSALGLLHTLRTLWAMKRQVHFHVVDESPTLSESLQRCESNSFYKMPVSNWQNLEKLYRVEMTQSGDSKRGFGHPTNHSVFTWLHAGEAEQRACSGTP